MFQQNLGLMEQTSTISKNFKQNDLILVSQKTSGSGWSLVAEPLRNIYNKQSVYFFNPEDYNKLDKSKFDEIYLIASDEEINLYGKVLSLKKVKDYTIKNQIIKPTKNPLQSPQFITTETKGGIYKLN